MRKRDRLRSALSRARNPSPLPPDPVSAFTPPDPPNSYTRTNNTSTLKVTPSQAANSGSQSTKQNQALQRAIRDHIATIPEDEKQCFRSAAQQMTDDTILEAVRLHDQSHRNQSSLRSNVEPVSRLLQGLARFTDAIAIGIQANPDVSSIIVGLARGVITIAIDFTGFFDKLTDMMTRMIDYLDPFTLYAKSARDCPAIEDCLVAVYVDLLTFFRSARCVFIDDRGDPRKWTSWRVFWRVQWVPFQEEFGTIEASLLHHRTVLHHTAQAMSLGKSFEHSRFELIRHEREMSREREGFLRWLSSYSSESIHDKIYRKKHPGTGDWLLCDIKFEQWLDASTSTVLCCYGKAGAGKSVLAANVIEHITSRRALDNRVGIVFIYYDYQRKEMQEESFVLSALIKQICRTGRDVPAGFLKIKHDALSPSQLGNVDTFLRAVEYYQMREIYLVIDALDECPKFQRQGILQSLRHIVDHSPCLKLLVTSRPEIDIQEVFLAQMKAQYISIEAQSIQGDICRFVTEETHLLRQGSHGRKLHITDPKLEDAIINTLTTKAEGMFLWVNLQLAHLCEESESLDDNDVRRALTTLPADVHSTYERNVDRIMQSNARRQRLALSTLRWVMYADRPLTMKELQEILKFEDGEATQQDVQEVREQFLLSICANMLEISYPGAIVKPIHHSVQEFFTTTTDPRLQGRLLNSQKELQQIHTTLATMCITYLMGKMSALMPCRESLSLHLRFSAYRFLWYAACFFDSHIDQSTRGPALVALTEVLLQRSSESLASILQARAVRPDRALSSYPDIHSDFNLFEKPVDSIMVIFSSRLYGLVEFQAFWKGKQLGPSLLHAASSSGLAEAVIFLVKAGIDVNAVGTNGVSPLYFAAVSGHVEVTRLLLRENADVNAQGGHYGNALQAASVKGYTRIVQMLMSAGVTINAQGGYYGDALQAACVNNHATIVKMLISKGADVNTQGGYYGNALQAASANDHESIVQMLMDDGANVNAQGGYYGNALQAASASNSAIIVEMLLKSGANVNAQGGHYGNALRAASLADYTTIVQMLLNNGANVNAHADDFGSALHAASTYGHVKTAQILIDNGADVNAQAGAYSTALQAASANNRATIVQILLDNGADVNAQGGHYGNALQASLDNGYMEVAQILRAHGAQ